MFMLRLTILLIFALTVTTVARATSPPAIKKDDWNSIKVPGSWEENAPALAGSYDGYAWYRAWVKIPATWKEKAIYLRLNEIDDGYQLYFNGKAVGETSNFPPSEKKSTGPTQNWLLKPETIHWDEPNLVAIRVFDSGGRGGCKGDAPLLLAEHEQLRCNGIWQIRLGDDLTWAAETELPVRAPLFSKVEPYDHRDRPESDPKKAEQSFKLPEDLELKQVLAEPTISQPLHISFDERGRLWLVEYRQYPEPAGLKIVSRDNYWRNIYDKVPPAPPNHFRGADRISIHEDADGDGKYEKHKIFVDGLSLVTSVARGRGGVWVLNPPYLLFYPDANNDDVPDGDPVVHLSGFGIEDSHSVTNSLRFGPDGWLYAAQGSTVSANVRRVGLDSPDKPGVQTQGQLLWRYHPESRRFEIFAEGGGNAFGLEIDAKGRMFSGHNGGDTRGFHYVQGAYLQKGFNKHGPLSNPYAFGYFPALKHDRVPRFTHEFVIYERGSLPEQYHGRMFAIATLLNHVSITEVKPRGSTFETKDLGFINSSDTWFRPVDITVGPDGSLYIADWYDRQTSHLRNSEGEIDKLSGRVYRLQAKGIKQPQRGDLSKKSTGDLIALLSDENIWVRQTVLRLLGDRRDAAAIMPLRTIIDKQRGQTALEALWAIYQSGGFDTTAAQAALRHPDPFVRLWAVRLLGDKRQVESAIATELAEIAKKEPHIEVRAQLACTAKRLPTVAALNIVRELAKHPDADDPQLPLLIWWAIEAHCAASPEAVLALFAEPEFSSQRLARTHLLARVMQRYASTGKRADLLLCAKLFEQCSKDAAGALMNGFETAFRGRTPSNLPKELLTALGKSGKAGLALRVRLDESAAIDEALVVLQDNGSKPELCEELLAIFGEIRTARALPLLLEFAADAARPKLQRAALGALGNFNDERIATTLIKAYPTMPPEVQPLAQNLLAGRAAWSTALLTAIDEKTITATALPIPIVKKLMLHRDPKIDTAVEKHWGAAFAQAAELVKSDRERLEKVLADGHGSPYDGKKLFTATCAKCHTLFSEGGQIGPDLTSYNREQVGNMLRHIVDPNAEIREGFETFAISTSDGRALTGFLADQDAQVIVLRGFNGENTNIPRTDIDEMRNTGTSLMPEGLLKDLTDKQVRDLFAYIRSTQPLNN
jgi:putative heme-binding domain-containing protein